MAKVKLNLLLKQLRGAMGDVVFRVLPTGETIISKRPDMSNVKWSKAQKAHRRRFKQAVEQAKAALAEPAMRLKYERMAKQQGKRPWDVALSAYLQGEDGSTTK
jgi:hypothetical protein